MNSDAAEDRMLLSGSVDFSPWNTAKLPDIGTPQTASEKRSRSKPPSPVPEDVGNGNLSPKVQRYSLSYSPVYHLALQPPFTLEILSMKITWRINNFEHSEISL